MTISAILYWWSYMQIFIGFFHLLFVIFSTNFEDVRSVLQASYTLAVNVD